MALVFVIAHGAAVLPYLRIRRIDPLFVLQITMTHAIPPLSPVVETIGVRKRFVRGSTMTEVLCGVDLAVRRGSCTLLTGPSGCGKSTLLAIIRRIVAQSRRGRNPHSRPVTLARTSAEPAGAVAPRLYRVRVSAVPSSQGAHRSGKCLRAVELTGRKAPARRGDEVLKCLDAVGLADKAHSDTHRLSHGQCQRVALARALVNDPDLILADEPTAAFDESMGQQVMALMQHLIRDLHKTAVIVTHDARIYHFEPHFWHAGRTAPRRQRLPCSSRRPA